MHMETPKSGHSVVVNHQGRAIAGDGTTPLRDRLLSAIEQGHGSILLDVGHVSYMDSLLLGELVQAYVSAVKQGATLELINATKRLRELLRITKLDRILKTVGPEPE
jgi:anti-sigma B factor antagonist